MNSELSVLVKAGKIEKVKRGVYRLSEASSINETTEPSEVPTNNFFTVQGIIYAGGDRRQPFLCTYTG